MQSGSQCLGNRFFGGEARGELVDPPAVAGALALGVDPAQETLAKPFVGGTNAMNFHRVDTNAQHLDLSVLVSVSAQEETDAAPNA